MMANPSVTPVDRPAPDTRTRVDSAHAADAPLDPSAPSLELLQAIAGQDSEQAALQLRRQALELAGLLRDKQRVLDQRESELNARTALFENEIRSSRLKQQQQYLQPQCEIASPARERRPTLAEALAAASTDDPLTEADRRDPPADEPADPPADEPAAEVDRLDTPRGEQTPSDTSLHEEQQHRALRQQQAKLDARQQQLEQLQEQITSLHRESLELRLASEEIWAELMEHYSSEELTDRLAELRNKLAEHYRLANESLAQRTDELHRMRQELHGQEQRFRGQRRELQLWVDRRYDEIQARTSRLIVRERELDRLEAEFERQSMQWQQQREAYRQEIEQLTRQS